MCNHKIHGPIAFSGNDVSMSLSDRGFAAEVTVDGVRHHRFTNFLHSKEIEELPHGITEVVDVLLTVFTGLFCSVKKVEDHQLITFAGTKELEDLIGIIWSLAKDSVFLTSYHGHRSAFTLKPEPPFGLEICLN